MMTAVDTNVLLDILMPSEAFYGRSAQALQQAAASGGLVICDLVYGELCAHFRARTACDDFIDALSIRVEALSRDALCMAAAAWRIYRRQGGRRERILPDFLIGAHAQTQCDRLLSRDRGFYRRLFPHVQLLDPSRS